MLPLTIRRRACALVLLLSGLGLTAARPSAQPVASAAPVAADADVQGAVRLFTAWLEGQLLYRHLAGVAVGVVADQQLAWSKGFGFADVAQKTPMTIRCRSTCRGSG